jgi:hypothetical protein
VSRGDVCWLIGDTDVAEIEVAHDPDTCRSVVERGTWADTNPSLSAGEGTASRSDSSSSSAPTKGTDDSAPASGDATTAAVSQKLAYSWSWYDEPARWIRGNDVQDSGLLPPVNTLRNRVEWYPDGNCAVAPGYTGWMYWDATWLTETGWSFAYHNWVTSPDPIDCRYPLTSKSYARFENRAFCALISPIGLISETKAHYSPNGIEGYKDGSARAYPGHGNPVVHERGVRPKEPRSVSREPTRQAKSNWLCVRRGCRSAFRRRIGSVLARGERKQSLQRRH